MKKESPQRAYIKRVRKETAHPVFRSFVRIVALLLYVAAAGSMIAAFLPENGRDGLVSAAWIVPWFGAAAAFAIVGGVAHGFGVIAADIADTLIDARTHDDE